MTVYIFDGTMDGLLTAVFDAFALHEKPETVLTEGEALLCFVNGLIPCIPMRKRRSGYGRDWRNISLAKR